MRNREEIAWAGGFYEGEGWVTSYRSTRYPVLGISQKDPEALDRFVAAVQVPGALREFRMQSGIKLTPIHSIRYSGLERVQAVVAMLWPWLTERRRAQVSSVLTAYVERATHKRNHCRRGHLRVVLPSGRRRCYACEHGADPIETKG